MLHVIHSNQVERLIDALTANIHQIRALNTAGSIFEKIEIVVPNWNLETYIKFQIARRAGIAANLRFHTLENFLTSCIPAHKRASIQIVSDKIITLLLLELLNDPDLLTSPDLRPIRSYLAATPTTAIRSQPTSPQTEDSLHLKRYQLARQLSKIFREYDYSRPEMLQAWPQNTTLDKPPFHHVERWQRLLWLAIFGPEGKLARLGAEQNIQYMRLSEVFASNSARQIPIQLPAHTHIFGLSYVAPLFENIFSQFKSRPEGVYFYALNPCEEFWEDVRPGNDDEEESHALTSTTGFFDYERDTPALRRWARPGRDNNRMLNRLSETVHETRFFAAPTPGITETNTGSHNLTLLQTLQEDIRHRAPERPPIHTSTSENAPHFPDQSIQFLACPSVQREAEVIANEIWHLIEQSNGTLRFNDIAVIVNHSQRELYQTHIRAVFKDTHDIPHNISDIAAASKFRLFEAIDLLFSLPFGEFRRRELLKLITHPNVIARENAPHGLKPEQITEQWIAWCNALNILHGADRTDHEDTYIEADLYNWDQGMRRLVLGAFMSSQAPDAPGQTFSTNPHDNYLPLEHSHTELESSASLVTLVRSLIADARFCRTTQLPLAEWATLMSRMLATYLGKTDNNDANELMRCHQILADIQSLDITGTPVPYRVAYQFLREALDILESQSGQYLVDGVVVTSFLPMRPIPFKIVFVTGMGEGKFPTPERHNPLDLQLASRQEGDVRSREQDKYMFLETLISTRERLYLSWVSRDNRTGDPLEPSSVVKELQYILAGYEAPEFLARRLIEHPLRRYDRAYFPGFYSATDSNRTPRAMLPAYGLEARQEAILSALHENLQSFTATHQLDFPDARKLQRHIPPSVWQSINARLNIIETTRPEPQLAAQPPTPETTRISLPIHALRRFLECPLQASARAIAGLVDFAETDIFAVENERFETERAPQRNLLRSVFLQAITRQPAGKPFDPGHVQSIYDEHAQRLELLGILPTGIFKNSERNRHLHILELWHHNLQILQHAQNTAPNASLQILRFGRSAERQSAEHPTTTELHPSITLELPGVLQADGITRNFQVEIYGDSQPLLRNHNLSLALLTRNALSDRDFLPGFFDHVLLAASGLLPEQDNNQPDAPPTAYKVFANNLQKLSPSAPKKLATQTRNFRALTPSQARDYLALLTRDLLSGVHDYLLPIEAVMAYTSPKNQRSFAEVTNYLLNQQSGISSLYGPVRRIERFAPPDEQLAKTIIHARFAPYFNTVEEEQSQEIQA